MEKLIRSLCGALLLVLLLSPTALAQNRIAFVTPTGQLATVAPDGSDRRTLTVPGRVFQFPAWSPGGEHIAAIGFGSEGGGVYALEDATEGALTTLYQSAEEPPIYLYWSPDGAQVAFLANRKGGLGLKLATLAGENRLLSTGNPFYWQWSNDSKHLLFHSGFGKGGRLGFLTTAPGANARVDNLAEPGRFNAPGLSVSERYLAYTEGDVSGGTRLVLTNNPAGSGPTWAETPDSAETEVRREVPYEGRMALSWSPTEEVLALMSPAVPAPHPYGPIRLLDAETGELTPLVEETALAFFWSPDGRHIAYLTPQGNGDGRVVGGVQQVNAQPAPLLLKLAVAEVTSKRTRTLTTFAPTPLFLNQFLPFFDQYALSHNLWSPQGNALVLPMLGVQGRAQVVVVPLHGEPRTLGGGEMPFWSGE